MSWGAFKRAKPGAVTITESAHRLTWIERWAVAVERPSRTHRVSLLAHQLALCGLDLLFPPHCVGCERVGSFLCAHCLAEATVPPERECEGLDGVCSAAEYDGAIGEAIRALKYDNQTRLAEPLAALLARAVLRTGWPIDLIVPVPLHAARLLDRGYNQAKIVGLHLARALDVPCNPSAARRVRDTPSQVNLNARERRLNVKGAFESDAEAVRGRAALVVDDVLTTGATLAACADALRLVGATAVFGATVAGAVLPPDAAASATRSPV